jgi:uncharacterized membrane protein
MTDARLRFAGLALSLCGVALAGYLTWVHYADTQTVCVGGGGSCERVQESDYAVFLGVPVAVIGLAGYLALASAFAIRHDEARSAAAFIGIVGMGFSAYLTYVEVFTVEAICQWCVASAVLMTAIAAIAAVRVLRASPTERRVQT